MKGLKQVPPVCRIDALRFPCILGRSNAHTVRPSKGVTLYRSSWVPCRGLFNLHHVLGGGPPGDDGTQRFKERVVLSYVYRLG